ncbi:MAG: HEAT repeat domain-containing protein [Gammaproteobacteria bacterium]|nr:HEAT repeat domain-containing protein [Gammaproteobacteria bacterium]
MNELQLIWWTSLILAFASLLVMLILVLRRLMDERTIRRDQHLRNIIQQILFSYMNADWLSGQKDLKNLMNLDKAGHQVLRRLATDLCHLIQGQEREQLTGLLDRTGFRDECLRDLLSSHHERRRTAVSALQLFADEKTKAALLRAMDDKDGRVRLAAASSLKEIDAMPEAKLLVRKLEEKNMLHTRDARTLFRDMARRTPQVLYQLAVANDSSLRLKIVIADAMSESSDFRVLEYLYHFANDANLNLRTTALKSLGTLQHPGAASVVEHALEDAQWQVRAIAAAAAGQIGLENLTPQLARLIDDDNWWVRFRSAEALTELGTRGLQALRERASVVSHVNDNAGGRMAALLLDEHGLLELQAVMGNDKDTLHV